MCPCRDRKHRDRVRVPMVPYGAPGDTEVIRAERKGALETSGGYTQRPSVLHRQMEDLPKSRICDLKVSRISLRTKSIKTLSN